MCAIVMLCIFLTFSVQKSSGWFWLRCCNERSFFLLFIMWIYNLERVGIEFWRSLLDYCVSFGAFNHADLREMGQKVGPHNVMLFRQVLDQLWVLDCSDFVYLLD